LDCDLPSSPKGERLAQEKVEVDRLAEYFLPMLQASRNATI